MMERHGKRGRGMKSRIAIWAVAGALVVVFWAIYIQAVIGTPLQNPGYSHGVGWALICLTCPVAAAGRHHAQTIYFALTVNAATYALVGAIVEAVRRYYRVRTASN
jgi:hypothetical protein